MEGNLALDRTDDYRRRWKVLVARRSDLAVVDPMAELRGRDHASSPADIAALCAEALAFGHKRWT